MPRMQGIRLVLAIFIKEEYNFSSLYCDDAVRFDLLSGAEPRQNLKCKYGKYMACGRQFHLEQNMV